MSGPYYQRPDGGIATGHLTRLLWLFVFALSIRWIYTLVHLRGDGRRRIDDRRFQGLSPQRAAVWQATIHPARSPAGNGLAQIFRRCRS